MEEEDKEDLFLSFRSGDEPLRALQEYDEINTESTTTEQTEDDNDDDFFDFDTETDNQQEGTTPVDGLKEIGKTGDVILVARDEQDGTEGIAAARTGEAKDDRAVVDERIAMNERREENVIFGRPTHPNTIEGSTAQRRVNDFLAMPDETGDVAGGEAFIRNSLPKSVSAQNVPLENSAVGTLKVSSSMDQMPGAMAMMKSGRFDADAFRKSEKEAPKIENQSSTIEEKKQHKQVKKLSKSNDKTLSDADIDLISSNTESLGEREIETDFTIKNLDTGENFSVQEIENKVPSGLPPVALHNKSTTSSGRLAASPETKAGNPLSSGDEEIHDGKKAKKKRKLFRRKKKVTNTIVDEKIKTTFENYVKSTSHKKESIEYADVYTLQTLSQHTGAVWCIEMNIKGTFMATAGRDMVILLWKVNDQVSTDDEAHLFDSKPFQKLYGHTADVLSLSWSENDLLLSASMDKTVRLWHITRSECLCTFQHSDSVTCARFNPKNSQLFMSGSLDERLRLWSITEKKVIDWVETGDLITSGTYTKDGGTIITGSLKGYCNFYQSNGLQYITQLHVHSKRGKNKKGKKITGIEIMPDSKTLLISSNDSRVRLYNYNDFSLLCKYKGHENQSSQLHASTSESGRALISGSENGFVYVWPIAPAKSNRKDRSESYESLECGQSIVTCAVFATAAMSQRANKEFGDNSIIIYSNMRGTVCILCNDHEITERNLMNAEHDGAEYGEDAENAPGEGEKEKKSKK